MKIKNSKIFVNEFVSFLIQRGKWVSQMTTCRRSRADKIKDLKNGYTVIELLVALVLFSVVIIGAIGSAVSAIDAHKDDAGLQDIEDNSRAIFESMIREIRTSHGFEIDKQDNDNDKDKNENKNSVLKFTSVGTSATLGGNIEYKLKNNNILRNNLVLNSNDVIIEKLFFSSNFNKTVPVNLHPRITIFMSISSKKRPNLNPVILQTTVSSRYYQ